MDIEFLLLLQHFREATNNVFTPFMEHVSHFSVHYLIIIPVLIYWLLNKEKGLYILASYSLSCGINDIIKLSACVYRPWIKDPRIVPAGGAVKSATGYSFPSGHTAIAGSLYGGLAVSFNKRRAVTALCIFAALLTGFSRCYLGVHTPQDVLAAFAETALALYIVSKLFAYIKAHPEKENIFLLVSFIIGWLGIIYITFKPYPTDFSDGKLLVDPQKMMNDGYADICLFIAFPVSRFIEKTFIKFEPAGLNAKGILICMAGIVPLYFMMKYMGDALDLLLGSHFGHFCSMFILVFYCAALYPIVIKILCNKKSV
ncbi:MAG: phosphatase PAP2 family protein [Clostridia bacterium]|nr:phosphatase PAP2 family protein [Clostridia bacterium]